MSALHGNLTPDELRSAIDMASDKQELLDQQGRRWARWYAGHPSCAAICAKQGCGKPIEFGYCLVGNTDIKICPSHVERRWL